MNDSVSFLKHQYGFEIIFCTFVNVHGLTPAYSIYNIYDLIWEIMTVLPVSDPEPAREA